MLQVLTFELGGALFALKLGAVDRILAPGEPLPEGCRPRELADLLERERPIERHALILKGGHDALIIGRPRGTLGIEPSWIVPLPGYMFRSRRVPVRGIIQLATRRMATTGATGGSRHCLLIDTDFLLEGGLESC